MTPATLVTSHDLTDIRAALELSPVIPVATISRVADAVPLAEALLDGGVPVIEITLRADAALAAIEAVRKHCPDMYVGAGTVWTAEQAMRAASAGAEFLVSPGMADSVQDVASSLRLPYLPGAQTATEIARLVARGMRAAKFFPAGPAGGPAALKALAAVFPDMLFCPTGGISEANALDYLSLPFVPCVGGSWLVAEPLLAAQNWTAVRALANRAAQLGKPSA